MPDRPPRRRGSCDLRKSAPQTAPRRETAQKSGLTPLLFLKIVYYARVRGDNSQGKTSGYRSDLCLRHRPDQRAKNLARRPGGRKRQSQRFKSGARGPDSRAGGKAIQNRRRFAP